MRNRLKSAPKQKSDPMGIPHQIPDGEFLMVGLGPRLLEYVESYTEKEVVRARLRPMWDSTRAGIAFYVKNVVPVHNQTSHRESSVKALYPRGHELCRVRALLAIESGILRWFRCQRDEN
jgi:hypothetical protein